MVHHESIFKLLSLGLQLWLDRNKEGEGGAGLPGSVFRGGVRRLTRSVRGILIPDNMGLHRLLGIKIQIRKRLFYINCK